MTEKGTQEATPEASHEATQEVTHEATQEAARSSPGRSVTSGRPVRQRLRLLVLVLGGLMLLIAGSALATLQLQQRQVVRTTTIVSPAYDDNRAAIQAMTDAQTALRGYQLSGDRSLLVAFSEAKARAQDALDSLASKVQPVEDGRAGDSHVALLAQRQRAASSAWWQWAEQQTAAAAGSHPAGGDPPGSDQAGFATGQARFDALRSANAALGEDLRAERDAGRLASRQNLSRDTWIILALTVLAVVATAVVASRASRSVTGPLLALRDVVARRREGDEAIRADEAVGAAEVRSLAADFNRLIEQNGELQLRQAEALLMHQLTIDLERLIRRAPDVQTTLDVVVAALGEGLGAERVMANMVDERHVVTHGAQWHLAELSPLGDVPDDLAPHVGQLAEELWLSATRMVLRDFAAPDVQAQERARIFARETGASSVIMVPIGLGQRVIGVIFVLMVSGPRRWTKPEANAVQSAAAYVARAIVEAEHEAHQREYVARLERLDRQKTDFLSTVSHELRTPLTSISGYLELLQDGEAGGLTKGQHQMLDVIDRNTSRLRGLIEDLLVLNRIEAAGLHSKSVDLSACELITHTVEELGPIAARAGVRLDVQNGPQSATVHGDPAHLQRALVNVISNAVKFTPVDGRVTVRCETDEAAGRVRFTCTDTGIGIPAADMEQLFTRFFRASNATGQAIPGTGLGLAIVKQIVTDHGGTMDLRSVEGQGTTVVIDLPLALPE